MHSLVRRFLKTGIAFLLIELRQRLSGPHVVSAHTHAILVGFVMMMILGVALWMFPRPAKEDVRYTPRAAEGAYWLLTVGTSVRIVGEVARPHSSALWLRAGVFSAGLLQVAGLLLFFYTMWSRIRAVGSQTRESRGERF